VFRFYVLEKLMDVMMLLIWLRIETYAQNQHVKLVKFFGSLFLIEK